MREVFSHERMVAQAVKEFACARAGNAELQRLKPLDVAVLMSWLKPRPTRIFKVIGNRGAEAKSRSFAELGITGDERTRPWKFRWVPFFRRDRQDDSVVPENTPV